MRRGVGRLAAGDLDRVTMMRSPGLLAIRWARRLLSLAWLGALGAVICLAAWSNMAGLVVVAGESMAPALPRGSLIQPRPVDPDEVRPGDVVTVRANNGVLVTHRVVRVAELPAGLHLELRGDANSTPDPVLVPVESVVGRIELVVPLAGFVVAMLASLTGLLSIASLLGAALLAVWLLEDLEAAWSAPSGESPAPLPGRHHAAS